MRDQRSTREAFSNALASAARQRRPLDLARDRGPFVVVGHPKHWASAADALGAAGAKIVAFHDLRLESRRLTFRGRPVWRGPWSGPLRRHPVVYAGPMLKSYFDGAPASVAGCLWHAPPTGWKQRAQHDPTLVEHLDEVSRVWAELADDASRDAYASVIKARSEGESDFFRIAPYREYDHPVVRARPGDTVIDAGAYWGDSARRFAWQMRGRGTVVAMEPSPASYARLARQRVPGLIPVCLGAWRAHEVLRFGGDGGSARISDRGASTIHAAPIDWLVRELGLERVDLLKLDVEGAEREALEGAAETLARFRPRVQLSIYHRREDVWELPALLRSRLDGYRFFLGHHGPYHTETDLYAIPAEADARAR